MGRSMPAGLAYFAVVFLAGMVLGAFRVFVLEPRFGPIRSVLAELPIMLGLSWLACDWAIRLFRVPKQAAPRVAMGGFAFLLLVGAELALALQTTGDSIGETLSSFTDPARAIGLAGQLIFAAMPFLQLVMERAAPPVDRIGTGERI